MNRPLTHLVLLFVSSIAGGLATSDAAEPTIVTFPSEGGIVVTANYYKSSDEKSTPLLLLFHRSGSSRGEYRDVAPKLVEAGFNCLAVDLRSGKIENEIPNLTTPSAQEKGIPHTHADSYPDLLAAAKYAREKYASGPLLAWGSSYSASLALKLAGDYPGGLVAVLAFSPGEYFEKMGKSPRWVQTSARHINVPVFFTSAKDEGEMWRSIAGSIKPNLVTRFLPSVQGDHGTHALFPDSPGNEEYWSAVMQFLKPWSSSGS